MKAVPQLAQAAGGGDGDGDGGTRAMGDTAATVAHCPRLRDRPRGAVPIQGRTLPRRKAGMNRSADDLAALSQLVLQLHRGSRDWPASSFAHRACELLQALMPHQACLWGSLPADAPPGAPPGLPGLHTQGLSADEVARCLAGNGPWPDVQAEHTEPLAGRRVRLQLWRHKPGLGAQSRGEAPLAARDVDAQTLNFLMPHLVEAQRENRLSRRYARDDAPLPRRSHALCDHEGVLQQVDEQGLALLRTEWRTWAGPRLPEPLVRWIAQAPADAPWLPFQGQQVTVLPARSGDLLLLDVRRRAAVDRLSTRQRDIALRYAEGQTGPQIAAQLGLSASTVNNHLGVIFKRLGVSNKVQLLNAVRVNGTRDA